MAEILTGAEGIVYLMDDILIYGRDTAEHQQRLEKVLHRLKAAKVTLNTEKCTNINQIPGADSEPRWYPTRSCKISCNHRVPPPKNVTEVRRFMGMVNQLGKFYPQLANVAKPIHELLGSKNDWIWEESQQKSFETIKQNLSSAPILALYDPQKETIISADASSYGLGTVITQKQPTGEHRPIAYISRVLTPTEQKYCQIEKEALAVTWACEQLSHYIIAMQFHIFTDQKPLVPLLDELPLRVQRFRMRLMHFQYTISHISGKSLTTADTLSRAPTESLTTGDKELLQATDL